MSETTENKEPIQQVKLDDDDETAQAGRILVFARAKRARLEDELKKVKVLEDDAVATIKDALGGEGSPTSTATLDGKPVATWYKGTTHRLNQKRLKSERPEVFERYYEEAPSEKFVAVVTAPEEK